MEFHSLLYLASSVQINLPKIWNPLDLVIFYTQLFFFVQCYFFGNPPRLNSGTFWIYTEILYYKNKKIYCMTNIIFSWMILPIFFHPSINSIPYLSSFFLHPTCCYYPHVISNADSPASVWSFLTNCRTSCVLRQLLVTLRRYIGVFSLSKSYYLRPGTLRHRNAYFLFWWHFFTKFAVSSIFMLSTLELYLEN